MNTLKSPLFIFSSLLFLAHQITEQVLKIRIPAADNYLDNLLAMPIILSLWQAERQLLFRKGKNYRLSAGEITAATVYIIVISELLFPLLAPQRFRADWWDVLFFLTGSLVFALTWKSGKTDQPGNGLPTSTAQS